MVCELRFVVDFIGFSSFIENNQDEIGETINLNWGLKCILFVHFLVYLGGVCGEREKKREIVSYFPRHCVDINNIHIFIILITEILIVFR